METHVDEVVKLNAIVEHAYLTIGEFDD